MSNETTPPAHSDKNAEFADWMLHGIEISGQAATGFQLNAAIRDVLVERQRQISVEGWTVEHDDYHSDGSMALAAACYACNAATWSQRNYFTIPASDYLKFSTPGLRWPWARKWWKPKSQRKDLIRAAALLIAEIERLDRLEAKNAAKG